jgi:hypothetical protein
MFSYGVLYFIFRSKCGYLRSSGIQFMNVTNTVLFGSFLNILEPSIPLNLWSCAKLLVRQRSLLKILKSNRRIIATITYLSRFYSTINTFLLAINLVAPVVAFLPCCDWIMLRVCRYRSVDTMVSVQ